MATLGGLPTIFHHKGITKRAPKWMQNIGMEWFYRFVQEPKRMWRRYLIGNLKFIWLVLREKIKIIIS
jgi:N-acetylglucosaminyldiphosphoundecaprenol N-acetyl-beta-D-mannosaminyltransferase